MNGFNMFRKLRSTDLKPILPNDIYGLNNGLHELCYRKREKIKLEEYIRLEKAADEFYILEEGLKECLEEG